MTILAKRIKELRKADDLTQTEFGRLFGIGKTTVSSWETGNSCPSDELKVLICKHFKVSMDYLIGFDKSATGSHTLTDKYNQVNKKGFYGMEKNQNYEKYSDALKDLFIPRIKEIINKSDITIEDCQKADEMFKALEKALTQEKCGMGLF